MKKFTYVATDMAGTRTTGIVEAISEGQARDKLAGVGLRVDSLQETGVEERERSVFETKVLAPIVGRVPLEVLQRFFAQLWSMYKSAVPLVQSLDTLASQERHAKMASVIREMGETVLQGRKLSEVMEKYPEVFSGLQTSLIRVGEEGGVLERSLFQVSDYLRREIELRNKIKRGTFYAKLVIFCVVAIPIATNMIVASISRANGAPMMGIQSFFSSPIFIFLSLGFLVGAFFFLRVGLENPAWKRNWDAFLLRVPYLGPTMHMLSMAKFSRAFSALYGGGIPIGKTVALSADACGNESLREQIQPAQGMIEGGGSIAESLARTKAFSRVALDMAHTGEHTGNLDAMFTNVAEQYEDEADVRFDKVSKVLPVFLILILGVVVLLMLVTFYQNYFSTSLDQV